MIKKLIGRFREQRRERERVRNKYSPENAMFQTSKPSKDEERPQHDDYLVIKRGGLALFVICVVLRLIVILV